MQVVWSYSAHRLPRKTLFTCALQSEPDVMEVEVDDKGQWRRVGAGGAGDGPWTEISADPASVPAPATTQPSANGTAVEVCERQQLVSRPSTLACKARPQVVHLADVAQIVRSTTARPNQMHRLRR